MLKKFKNEEGFTLVEAIISIATLAIISVFVVQMFIVSDEVNNKTYIMDKCNSIVVDTVELIKSESPEIIEFYNDCYVANDSENIILYKGFDENFQEISIKDSTDKKDFPPEVKYILETELVPLEPSGEDTIFKASSNQDASEYDKMAGSGKMCDISVRMYDYSEKTWENIIRELTVIHYFSNSTVHKYYENFATQKS